MSNRNKWALAGFIAVTILVVLHLYVGLRLGTIPDNAYTYLTIPLLSLASGIIGAWYFYTLYPLYAGGRRLTIYLSTFAVALALILPVIDVESWVYYAPGIFILLPLGVESGSIGLFFIVNISWVGWGLVGLGIGYLLGKPSKRTPKLVDK